jgi:hypothetical protein
MIEQSKEKQRGDANNGKELVVKWYQRREPWLGIGQEMVRMPSSILA